MSKEPLPAWRVLWESRKSFQERAHKVFSHPSWPGRQPHFGPLEIQNAYDAGIVPKYRLKHGVYYYGNCRNAVVARWNQDLDCFEYMRTKFSSRFSETIRTMEDDDGWDIFFPICEIEPDATEVIE